MTSLCGIECDTCFMKAQCKGCRETDGRPFGGDCAVCLCLKKGGEAAKARLIEALVADINALQIPDMPAVTTLVPLSGAFVNLEYPLPNGKTAKLLDDTKIYLGYQLAGTDGRCFGLVADESFLLVASYGENGADPVLLAYRKR